MIKKCLIILLVIAGFGLVGHAQSHYTRKDCKIVEVDCCEVTVADGCGFTWTFFSQTSNDYKVGDTVNIEMFDNYTSGYVFDDEIVGVK